MVIKKNENKKYQKNINNIVFRYLYYKIFYMCIDTVYIIISLKTYLKTEC